MTDDPLDGWGDELNAWVPSRAELDKRTELEQLAAAVVQTAVRYVTGDQADFDTGEGWPELEAATLAYVAAERKATS